MEHTHGLIIPTTLQDVCRPQRVAREQQRMRLNLAARNTTMKDPRAIHVITGTRKLSERQALTMRLQAHRRPLRPRQHELTPPGTANVAAPRHARHVDEALLEIAAD